MGVTICICAQKWELAVLCPYSGSNAVKWQNNYSALWVMSCIDLQGEGKMVLKLDAIYRYWNFDTDIIWIDAIALVTHHGILKCTKIVLDKTCAGDALMCVGRHFGLCTVAASHCLYWWHNRSSETMELLLKHIAKLLLLLKSSGITHKLKITILFDKSVQSVGHTITAGLLQVP